MLPAFPDWLWPILAGPFAGSLAGVLVRRIPAGRPVVLARSACEDCQHPLGVIDLVPVLSFVLLRGRCRHCGARIAPFHLAVELAAAAVAVIAAAWGLRGGTLWAACGLGWVLLTLAWIDARHLRLPDVLTLPLLIAGLLVTELLDPAALPDHALASAVGYAALRLLAAGYWAVRRKVGLGGGDAKLLAALGAWLGVAALPQTLLAAALAGLAYGLVRAACGRRLDEAIPFGPFLSLGGWIGFLWAFAPSGIAPM